MITPTIHDFDGWRNSPVGQWFFEYVLQGLADEAARQNGRAVGTYATRDEDYLTYVRNAGHISGVEYAITLDPFETERESLKEAKDEVKSHGTLLAG
jgi:hypothetical protein